jgi:hypothetical protein
VSLPLQWEDKLTDPRHNPVMLPVAHLGHWLWALYLPPVAIVAFSLTRSKLNERRQRKRKTD